MATHSSDVPGQSAEEAQLASTFAANSTAVGSQGETGKIAAILGFLKNAIGVKDLGSLRVSLPASVCDPLSFLEHMVLLDRPEMFTAIPECEDPEQRILAVLRFLLSTNGVHMRKLYKSYNPVLGERYTCYYESEKPLPLSVPASPAGSSSRASASSKRSTSTRSSDIETVVGLSENASINSKQTTTTKGHSGSTSSSRKMIHDDGRIIYLTEQVSHHPPKMAFAYICPSKQLSFTGICHISGRFTGTSVKLRHQYGMEISLPTPGDAGEMETYRMTFPRGSIKGFVTLSPYVQLEEVSMIVCRKTGLRVVIHYKDEKWYSVSRSFLISGFVARFTPTDEELPPLKNPATDLYPGEKILYTFQGDWQGKVTVTNVKTNKSYPLIDMTGTDKLKKHRIEKPMEQQTPLESQQVWSEVNTAILNKDFSAASRSKTAVEDRQRALLAARKSNGIMTYNPELFTLESVPRYGPESIPGLEDFPTDDCPVDNKSYWIRASLKPGAINEAWNGEITDLREVKDLGREIDKDVADIERGIRELRADEVKDQAAFA